MTNSIDDYKNLVVLLEQALKFYANESNYAPAIPKGTTVSLILLDQGSQARFALDKIKDFNEMYQKVEDEYLKSFASEKTEIDDNDDDFLKIIKQFKNMTDGSIDIQ